MEPSIVVVGSINIDLVARCERLPAAGEPVAGLTFETYHGGKGANQAVASARLGQIVALVGAVGSDHYGLQLMSGLAEAGVNTEHVRHVQGASGTAVILTSTSAENSIVVVPGANGTVNSDCVAQAFQRIGPARVVMAQLELPVEAVERAAICAHERNATFVLDPAPVQPLSQELLEQVDWLTPNSTEASVLLGEVIREPSPSEAMRLAAKLQTVGARNVLLKLGAHGVAVVTSAGEHHYLAAFKVAAVDTTAAGDAFNGGFAAALCRKLPLEECVRYASAVAALSVTRAGAQASMPTYNAVSEFLARHQEGAAPQ